jgi:hypothetical protein
MNLAQRGLVVPALALTLFGCASSAYDGAERPPESVAVSTNPDTSTSAGTDPDTPAPKGTDPGSSGALCRQLKTIADADAETSSLPRSMRLAQMSQRWPEIAAAYDAAMASAPPDLAEDLRAIKRVSEVTIQALAGQDGAGVASALSELTRTHAAEIRAGGMASIRATRFTEETCGFSLNNE